MRVLSVAAFVSALLLIAMQAAFAVRGIVDPGAGAAGFGLPADGAAAHFYHAVYRDRNLVIALIGLVLLLSRMWRALAIVFAASTTLPVYDIFALKLAGAPVLPLHYITLAALVVVTGLLVLRALKAPASP